MSEDRELELGENIKVVTINNFITACGIEDMSLNARKLLYLAISQCKLKDTKFYESSIKLSEFANLIGTDVSNLYRKDKKEMDNLKKRKSVSKDDKKKVMSEIDKITDELMRSFIRADIGKGFDKYNIISKCSYNPDDSHIYFKINSDMTDFFLLLKKRFTQTLLNDFVKMKSSYSMAIWHLMQREMHGKKPWVSDVLEFTLSLEELRQVTGTANQATYDSIGNFKNKILDKALREIAENCSVNITYTNIKESRTVTGFRFTAVHPYHIDKKDIPQEKKDKIAAFQQKQKQKT